MSDDPETASKQPLILIVDNCTHARRVAVLRDAIAELAQVDGHDVWKTLGVQHLTPADVNTVASIVKGGAPTIVLVVVDEKEYANLAVGKDTPRRACESIACGYAIVDQIGSKNDLYFVVKEDTLTGIDVVALLLSGARGIIDTDLLGSTAVVKALLRAWRDKDSERRLGRGEKDAQKQINRLLIGHAYSRLARFSDLVQRGGELAPTHWQLLVALAQIPRLRLPVYGQVSQTSIAQEISKWYDVTGYAGTSNTYRHIPLVKLILQEQLDPEDDEDDDEYDFTDGETTEFRRTRMLQKTEMFDLPYLPLYARQFGFPARLIPIRGLEDDLIADRVYRELRRIAPRTKMFDGLSIGQVFMPGEL